MADHITVLAQRSRKNLRSRRVKIPARMDNADAAQELLAHLEVLNTGHHIACQMIDWRIIEMEEQAITLISERA